MSADVETAALFDDFEFSSWWAEWQGMPEYVHEELAPWKSILVHFANRTDMELFAKLVGQTVTDRTQSVWYPEAEIGRMATKRYADAGLEFGRRPRGGGSAR